MKSVYHEAFHCANVSFVRLLLCRDICPPCLVSISRRTLRDVFDNIYVLGIIVSCCLACLVMAVLGYFLFFQQLRVSFCLNRFLIHLSDGLHRDHDRRS